MRKIFSTILLLALSAGVFATPAKRGVWKTVKLADGTEIRVELRGDEHLNFWQAEDGKCYRKVFGTTHFAETDIKALGKEALQKQGSTRKRVNLGDNHPDFVGCKKGLIILAEFTDKKFMPGHDAEYYSHVANDLDFTHSDGFVGSIRDYFLAQSEGKFDLTFDVIGPIELQHEMAYYGAHTETGLNDCNPEAMVREAVKGAVKVKPDLSEYDWFGDSYVDQVFVIYAGRGEADGGGDDTIWPHRSQITRTKVGSKYIRDYACSNEMQEGSKGKDIVDGIGAFCHEFSHCLGLPDLYDIYGGEYNNGVSNYGMSYWDVMDVGCYLGNAFRPCGYSGYERNYCGWKEPIVLENDTIVENAKPMSEGGDFYIIYNDACPDEYYILENRGNTGWDTDMYGEGLLITHIDFDKDLWFYNIVNSHYPGWNDHERYSVFLADNKTAIKTTADIQNDLYPYKQNNELTNTSTPAAILYHPNTKGEMLMSKPIKNIQRNADKTISFEFYNETKEVSAIEEIFVSADSRNSVNIFTIDGRFAGNKTKSLSPGLYIKNGKKVFIK